MIPSMRRRSVFSRSSRDPVSSCCVASTVCRPEIRWGVVRDERVGLRFDVVQRWGVAVKVVNGQVDRLAAQLAGPVVALVDRDPVGGCDPVVLEGGRQVVPRCLSLGPAAVGAPAATVVRRHCPARFSPALSAPHLTRWKAGLAAVPHLLAAVSALRAPEHRVPLAVCAAGRAVPLHRQARLERRSAPIAAFRQHQTGRARSLPVRRAVKALGPAAPSPGRLLEPFATLHAAIDASHQKNSLRSTSRPCWYMLPVTVTYLPTE